VGGPRESRIARSATDRWSHGSARGRTTTGAHGGSRAKTGVRTSHPSDPPPKHANAVRTIRAIQATATALRRLRIRPLIVAEGRCRARSVLRCRRGARLSDRTS
jgi:hypothetical protein